ncbi:hypothetical protein [Pseudoxanthomonas suwonensis]|uniref:DUF4234 domain-containing protein n=1 Tax=Pseudoxanthomonas suwonensis TaxID=314722 RepID=A0A0E3YZZ5_9GAMM|nr:hypothetical protein [Pseudoxanthomonas suwonensis]AKC85763.1 hypothetical protein WQ53_02315 [Pseudoxanthomonas suwonensis]
MQSDVPNPYQAPAAIAAPQGLPPRLEAAAVDTTALFAPPALKLVVMSSCTFGLYVLYWFYCNWKAIKLIDRPDVMPFWRALFSPIWAYSCFKAMAGIAEGRRRSLGFSPGALAISYFLLNLASRLPDPYWVLSFLIFVPLLPVNSLARAYNQAERIGDPVADEYSVWNWLAIVFGGGVLLLLLLGLMLPDTSY